MPWLINNFIQIYCLKDLYNNPSLIRRGTLNFLFNRYGDWSLFELSANPCIDYERITYQSFRCGGFNVDIVEFIKNQLQSGRYAFIGIDKYYISEYAEYMTMHTGHTLFINGFCNSGFMAHDNFAGGKYREAIIDFSIIEKAFYSMVENDTIALEADNYGLCFLFPRIKERHSSFFELFTVNQKTISESLREYLMHEGYGSQYKHIDYFVFGVNCYSELMRFIQQAMEGESTYIDHRAFSHMFDHKKLMLYRMDYISTHLLRGIESTREEYNSISDLLQVTIQKIIKFNISKKHSLLTSIMNNLTEIKEREIICLGKLLDRIEGCAV